MVAAINLAVGVFGLQLVATGLGCKLEQLNARLRLLEPLVYSDPVVFAKPEQGREQDQTGTFSSYSFAVLLSALRPPSLASASAY